MSKVLIALVTISLLGRQSTPIFAGSCSSSARSAGHAHDYAEADLIDTALSARSFTILATALGASGLMDALRADGPFTVFAPTDEAFSRLPEGTVQELLRPENRDELKAILTYHVVAGEVTANQVVRLDRATTLNGGDVDVRVRGNSVRINNARVVQTDVLASNGVIHVIDRVLLPQG